MLRIAELSDLRGEDEKEVQHAVESDRITCPEVHKPIFGSNRMTRHLGFEHCLRKMYLHLSILGRQIAQLQ